MTNATTYGTGVTFSGGSVSLAAGTYEVSYSWQGDAQGNGLTTLTEIVSAYLTLGGVEVAGSRIKSTTYNTVSIEAEVANTMTIVVPAGGATLQLFNGAAAMAHNSTLAGITGSINVEQVA